MNTLFEFLILIAILLVISNNGLSATSFNKDFHVTWSYDHAKTSYDGKIRTLTLDKNSGTGFASNDQFLFGQFDMQIKLIPGNPAGTVVAFYLTSDLKNGPTRDEIDIEFVGGVFDKTNVYVLQTNVFLNGDGNRVQRIVLWFDPSEDYHNYSILWNTHQIGFMVDQIPIRTFINYADKKVPFPNGQPMSVVASIWDGSNWARGEGRLGIDWAKAPFVASFENPKIDACIIKNMKKDSQNCRAANTKIWWNQKSSSSLTPKQSLDLRRVRKHYLIYDYCVDKNNPHPKECSLNKY